MWNIKTKKINRKRNILLSKNKIKVEICLCKSKRHADKREDIKKRDAKREARRYSDI
ncbi:MAG: SsrA-binding protein [Malacoplasma sp.]|nr:SsrA-binding protein [Malacoplasma sp.]